MDTHARYFVESAPLYPVLLKKVMRYAPLLERVFTRDRYKTTFLNDPMRKVLYNANFVKVPVRNDLYNAIF